MSGSTQIKRAVDLLKAGQLVALPTETVYGLAANALHEAAVQKIFELKGRPSTNPLIVHLAEFEEISNIAHTTGKESVLQSLRVFWPGPLTLVLPKKDVIPSIVTAGLSSVAVRIPAHPVCLAVLKACGLPLAAPSANISNYISPTKAEHVVASFGKRIPLVLDGGLCAYGLESTVLSLLGDVPVILRPGAVTKEMLLRVLPEVEQRVNSSDEKPLSPGQALAHYAPRTPLVFLNELSEAETNSCLICHRRETFEAQKQSFSRSLLLTESNDVKEAAKHLFSALWELDTEGYHSIVVEPYELHGLGIALMDRLTRASKKRP